MHTHRTQQTIVSLPICQLYPHPDNANRMNKVKFNKLIDHLEATGQYEPLVVRKHPTKVNRWQLLNGHHRLRALRQLKHTRVDCVVFAAAKTQEKPFLLPMTFFMTESQHATITRAFDKANGENTDGGRSGKRLAALCQMAEAFLGG